MNSRPRRKRHDRWRWQVGPSGGGAALGVECLEPRFLLSGSSSFVGVPPQPAVPALVPVSSTSTTGSVSDSGSVPGAVASPTSPLTSAPPDMPGPPSVLVAVSTTSAGGAASVTVTPMSTTDGTVSLPDVASPAVVDVASTVKAEDVFYVPNAEDAASIDFDLHSLLQTQPLAEELDVYSASGKTFQVAARSPSSTSETLTVHISDVPDAAAGLFVRVKPLPGFTQNTQSPPWLLLPYFLLQITRNGPFPNGLFPSGPAPGGQSPTSSPLAPTSTTPPVLLSILERYLEVGARAAEADNAVPVLAAPGELTVPLTLSASVPTGPLPARSAAPLGGVLATGDPVPQVDRRDAVAVDLELIGLRSDEPAAPADALVDAGDAIDPSVRLTAVRGPGGFPLLASAQERPVAAALAALPWASSPVLPEASLEAENVLAPLPTALRENPEVRTHPSVGAGLTLVLPLVFGPELPNLAAAFQRDEPLRDRSHTRRRHRTV